MWQNARGFIQAWLMLFAILLYRFPSFCFLYFRPIYDISLEYRSRWFGLREYIIKASLKEKNVFRLFQHKYVYARGKDGETS